MSQQVASGFDAADPAGQSPAPLVESAGDAASRAAALGLLVPAAPVMGLFWLLMKVIDRQPGGFLYSGPRMGRHKKPFTIYKIRTLVENAEALVGGEILRPGTDLELKYGRFLRETRLDELPQLFNVLRGDMRFMGPRPVRHAVYEAQGRKIRGFDLRFRVKPGLTGYSQFLTPHRAPQRIRAYIDNLFVRRNPGMLSNALFVAWTAWRVARKSLAHGVVQAVEGVRIRKKGDYDCDWRGLPRVDASAIGCRLLPGGPRVPGPVVVAPVDMNYYAISLLTDAELEEEDEVKLQFHARGRHHGRLKTARCSGVVYRKTPRPGSDRGAFRYVVFYKPVSPLNRYIVDQYMLHLSLVY